MLVALTAGACLASACGKSSPDEKTGPFLEARWSGADSGKISGPATAEWCDSLRLLEVRAVQGDTGIGLALYPKKEFVAERYPVAPPAKADTSPPAAAVALRWFAETSIRGFQGDSGSVVVQESSRGVYSGVIEAHAHSVTDGNHVTITGSFSHLSPRPATRGCAARTASRDASAGVH
ncbi:MAG: hypothetical protein ACREL3_08800 [Gemmatimonadales bacterium]